MNTRPFTHETFDEAMPLLSRGFPEVARETWVTGVARAARAPRPELPLGHLIEAKGSPVGVILTLASRRERQGADPLDIVNLSSWYVDPEHRLRAPAMLRRVTADPSLTYTDLTATDSTARINELMGFVRCGEERIVVPLPLPAASPQGRAEMVPLERLPSGALPPSIKRLLEDHAEMGCVCGVLADEDGWHPLVFIRRRRAGVPVAILAFAHDRGRLLRHLGTVCRFLLRRSALALVIDGAPAEAPLPFCAVRVRRRPRFVKSPVPMRGLDYAYSELALFGV